MADAGGRTFDLSLVTPEGAAFEGEVEMVVVPGDAGEIGVLARHAPLVALLRAGEVRVKSEGQWQSFASGPGYFQVRRDRAIALVDDAVRAEEIDGEQARRDAEEARAALERGEGEDHWFGAVAVNLVAAELLGVGALIVWIIAAWPNVPWTAVQFTGPVLMIALPVLFYPFSRALWLAWDLYFRPVRD
jgi:F-type H+-transporting ATPase subunit epsilon